MYACIYIYTYLHKCTWESSCERMAKVQDCRLAVSKFKLQSHSYVHFWTNTLEKGMNLLILPSCGLNSITAVFLPVLLWH